VAAAVTGKPGRTTLVERDATCRLTCNELLGGPLIQPRNLIFFARAGTGISLGARWN